MNRQVFRFAGAFVLVVLTVVATMFWSSEYDSNPDPKARFEIQSARLTPDHDYAWLEIHLKKSGEKDHDLEQKVRLVTDDGAKHDPADTTFAGTPEEGFTDIWFKFWLEQGQLEGNLALEINEGVLKVKNSQPVPTLEKGGERVFKSVDWKKSWLGF
jgi:hypothetical protein